MANISYDKLREFFIKELAKIEQERRSGLPIIIESQYYMAEVYLRSLADQIELNAGEPVLNLPKEGSVLEESIRGRIKEAK